MGIQLNGITGDAIIPGDVGIGGTLTYEDVANVDSIGVITARDGIRCTGICTATTFSGSGASLTNLPSAQLTGALPAIDGSNLTGIAADKIFEGNTEVETIDTGSDGHIKFTTEGSERLRITSAGKILGGNHLNDRGAVLQIESSDHAMIGIHRNTNDHGAPAMNFSASRGTSAGSNTIVQSGDYLGLIRFSGTDGSDLASGAQITGIVDGTPGSNDMPTRLGFWTSADGSQSPVERLRINSDGHITKPSQAMFSAAGSGNAWVIFNSGSGWYNLGDSSFDGSSYYRDHGWTTTGRSGVGVRGVTSSGASVWDNAKGRFTAPVNGFYFFEINLYIRAYSGGHTLHVNPWIGSTNTDYYTSNIGIIRNSSNSVTGNTQQYPNSVMRSIVLYLTANQEFRWSIYAENDRFESYKSQAHQSGYLIG